MDVLVINCGSSSLKFQLIDSESENVLAKGLCERIGIDGSSITYKTDDKVTREIEMPTHHEAIKAVIDMLTDGDIGVVSDMSQIKAVGHRVVHGGEYFSAPIILNEEVIGKIEECNDLAPLHNPANIIGIRACMEIMPGVPNVAVFDTAFHQTMDEASFLYAIPRKYYDKYKIRRYGFHGTSHSFVSKRMAKIVGKPYNDIKTIVCHLGNGASICAVENGKSVDTSMGLTPLSGVVMGTRSGDIDPGILEVISKFENFDVKEVTRILNKESGVYGLSENSSDFRDINKAIDEGDEKAIQTMDVYVRAIVRFIGAYVAVMNGVDYIVFTAGVGENNPNIRKMVCDNLSYLGIKINNEINEKCGEEIRISSDDSSVGVYVIPTNEELAICQETVRLLS